ncbi:MAG: alpha/beta hydrolase [Nevskia sp.]|nr:alpha/beta hydrolase [Nevskia sp.]
MSATGFQLPLANAAALYVHCWLPAAAPTAALLIVHGMAEHGARYARLAAALNAQGIAVYAPDLPGHGLSVQQPQDRGFFKEHDGWGYALDAIHQVRLHVAAAHAGLPLLLLGHSMGSFLSQHYLVEHGAGLAGAVLSATTGSLGPTRALGATLLRAEGWLFGKRHPSALAEALSFKTFNKRFDRKDAPARTAFDWLSRDPDEVDRYIADPQCGFRCSAQLWVDLLDAGAQLLDPARLARIPRTLPILLIAGSDDPVSGGASGPNLLAAAYRKTAISDVGVKIYPQGRHELLNDICREQVTADLSHWFAARIGHA